MTVAEFAKLWNSLNKSELNIKYYYNNKPIQLFILYTNNDLMKSIKLTITQLPFTSKDVTLYSDTYEEFSQPQSKFFDTLKAYVPVGSFVYTLNVFIN